MAKQPAKSRKAPAKPAKRAQNRKASTESDVQAVDVIPPEVHASPAKKEPPKVSEVQKPTPKIEKPAPVQAAQPPVAPQGNRFLPLVLGGLVAGIIGFAIATLTNPTPNADLSDQAAAIAQLERQIADQPTIDLTDIEAAQSDLAAQIAQIQLDMQTALDTQSERIGALERLPRGQGVASVPAIAAYEAELDALRAQIDEMTDIAVTQLDTARAEVAAIENNAAAAARNAAARAALARIQTALESGAPLGAALGDLEAAIGEGAPDALIAVQDGVPTLASLQDQFPEFARAALTTARNEGVAGEENSGFGAFMRNQFEVRSVAPREGTDSDAILSRAEAAVRAGRLADALAEISALPEVARAEMSDWLALAEARADAIAAVDILSTSLNNN